MEQRPDDDTPYDPPAWLQEHFELIREALPHYDFGKDFPAYQQHIARATAELSAEYFSLYMRSPDEAISQVPDYLERFCDINRDPRFEAGVLNPIVPEQFGLIANIATLQYAESPAERRSTTLHIIGDSLVKQNTLQIPYYTAELRNPAFVRDLCAHWDIYLPNTRNYASMLQHADWPIIESAMANHRTNPLTLALAVPLPTTPPETRARFRQQYEKIADQGVNVLAAALLSRGASDEVSRDILGHERFPMTWEDSIYRSLDRYAEEYPALILTKIASGAGASTHVTKLAHPRLIEKLQSVTFSFDEYGILRRVPRVQ